MGLLTVLVTVPAPAAADFHPVCEPPAAAYANVGAYADLDGSQVTYAGGAYCPGTTVTITALTLFSVQEDPAGDILTEVDTTSGDPCASTTLSPCIEQASVAGLADGIYEIQMSFDVDDPATPGVDFEDVERRGRFLWAGAGQPVPLCVHNGINDGAPVPAVGAC